MTEKNRVDIIKTNTYRYEMILQNISNNTNYNNTKSDRKAA
jgi:hypothetical protein